MKEYSLKCFQTSGEVCNIKNVRKMFENNFLSPKNLKFDSCLTTLLLFSPFAAKLHDTVTMSNRVKHNSKNYRKKRISWKKKGQGNLKRRRGDSTRVRQRQVKGKKEKEER